MAKLLADENELTVSLSTIEKIEAVRGNVTVPRSAVTRVRAVSNGLDEVHGWRFPGTGFPGTIKVGTVRNQGTVTFAVCHGKRPAVVIELAGVHYDRIVVTVDDPNGIVVDLTSS